MKDFCTCVCREEPAKYGSKLLLSYFIWWEQFHLSFFKGLIPYFLEVCKIPHKIVIVIADLECKFEHCALASETP